MSIPHACHHPHTPPALAARALRARAGNPMRLTPSCAVTPRISASTLVAAPFCENVNPQNQPAATPCTRRSSPLARRSLATMSADALTAHGRATPTHASFCTTGAHRTGPNFICLLLHARLRAYLLLEALRAWRPQREHQLPLRRVFNFGSLANTQRTGAFPRRGAPTNAAVRGYSLLRQRTGCAVDAHGRAAAPR